MSKELDTDRTTLRLWDGRDLLGFGETLAQMGSRRVLAVLGKESVEALSLRSLLAVRLRSLDHLVFPGVGSGSPISSALGVQQAIREFQPDTVVAIGGGSVIDTAKAACALAPIEEPLTERHVVAMWSSAPAQVRRRTVRLVVIPTTAGTGTEATPYSVLSDRLNNKFFGVSSQFQPDLAVLVPDFVTTVPQNVIADLAMDAMAHALEAFWSRRANPSSDLAATTAICLLDSHLWDYYARPTDRRAAWGVLLAATQAGEAFRLASSTACHALSFPLATTLGASHGHACSLLLALIAERNLSDPGTRFKLDGLARVLGLHSADDIPCYVRKWRVKLRLDRATKLQVGFYDVSAPALCSMMENNPIRLQARDIDSLMNQLSAA